MRMADTPWAHEILEEGAGILNSLGVTWWLEAGALLGIYREGKLLDHDDPDIDVTILEPANHDEIEKAFLNEGYVLYAHGPHQTVMKKRSVLFDISFYVREEDKVVMFIEDAGTAIQDLHLFDPLGEIEFMGHKYPVPNNIEEYLVKRYGDWKTPKKEKKPWTHPGETLVWHDVADRRILTYGTFDCMHFGHIRLLERAKDMGSYLVVGLSTDKFNAKKGKESVFNFRRRREDLEAIKYVDEIIEENTWKQKKEDIIKHNIDLLVMGDDWKGKFDDLGVATVYLPRTPSISTTQIKRVL